MPRLCKLRLASGLRNADSNCRGGGRPGIDCTVPPNGQFEVVEPLTRQRFAQHLQTASTDAHVPPPSHPLFPPRNSRLTAHHIASLQTPATNILHHSKTLPLARLSSLFLPSPSALANIQFALSRASGGQQQCWAIHPSSCRRLDASPRGSPPAVPIRRGQEKMFQCFSFPFLFPARLSPETLIQY
jgi:hypothetical protein